MPTSTTTTTTPGGVSPIVSPQSSLSNNNKRFLSSASLNAFLLSDDEMLMASGSGEGQEVTEDEVRRLAELFSPQVRELDALMATSPILANNNTNDINDDGSIDDEIQQLEESEQLLRKELELLASMGATAETLIMRADCIRGDDDFHYDDDEEQENNQQRRYSNRFSRSSSGPPLHVETNNNNNNSSASKQQTTATSPMSTPSSSPRHYAAAAAAGANTGSTSGGTRTTLSSYYRSGGSVGSGRSSNNNNKRPSLQAHEIHELEQQAQAMGLLKEKGGWYSVDMTSFLVHHYQAADNSDVPLPFVVKDFCLPLPIKSLRTLYVGIADAQSKEVPSDTPGVDDATTASTPQPSSPTSTTNDTTTPRSSNSSKKKKKKRNSSNNAKREILPIRTVAIRVRPDVLVGAVMDAIHHALDQVQIVKRQGGHFQGYGGGLLVDVQLCLYRSDECQRHLVIRAYYYNSATDDHPMEQLPELDQQEQFRQDQANRFLQQACALIQRMEMPLLVQNKILPPSPCKRPDFSAALDAVADDHDEQQQEENQEPEISYRPCPSVVDGDVTLPSLSDRDLPYVQESWKWIHRIWEELETRDLTYWNLASSCRFGAFPALPTLDVHFCSQMRRYTREAMVSQLLKSASELEEYARESEYACANLIALLRPAFEVYDIDPPSLPQAVNLASYPLEFVSPQAICPPWGGKVMEAINKVAAVTADAAADNNNNNNAQDDELSTSSGGSAMWQDTAFLSHVESRRSLDMAQNAVHLVLEAFQKQDDEEQAARLQRKNVQVMDRLAKMRAHQRHSIAALQRGARSSSKATKALGDFVQKAKLANNSMAPNRISNQVPLLKSSILVGGTTTGTCLVTASYVLFVTQLIPVVGKCTASIFELAKVEFEIKGEDTAPSLLNPLPTVMTVRSRETQQEVFSFRPSLGGTRLLTFLEAVKSVEWLPEDDENEELALVATTANGLMMPVVTENDGDNNNDENFDASSRGSME